jgi:Domain of unknown function (DUF6265)
MRTYSVRLAVALTLVLGSTQPVPAAECSLATLNWMAGNWHNASDPRRAQERWVVAPGGVLMGSSWEFPEGKAGYAEVMTVRPDGDATVMVLRHFDGGLKRAWEERDGPMVFRAALCDRNSAVFDGQGDHVGEHLTYKRTADQLLIVGDFLHHGTPDHEEWHMIRSTD